MIKGTIKSFYNQDIFTLKDKLFFTIINKNL